jgi:pimeloyl-ACP methyl ester carboxylesterase
MLTQVVLTRTPRAMVAVLMPCGLLWGRRSEAPGQHAAEDTVPYADNGGIRIHYEVEGDGPPLALQAGTTLSIDAWRQFGYVDALKNDYRLILIDPRGHGASDKPHDPAAYAMELRAGDVVAVLDDLGIEQTHYLGYSMGGRIGFDTAKLAPERLRSLIIGGATPYAADRQADRTQMFSGGMEAMLERQSLPDEVNTPAFRAMMLANDVEALIAAAIDFPSVEDILPTLTIPCLIFVGDADRRRSEAERYAQLLSAATFVSLPGLDHWAGLYRSDVVLPHVRAFLDRVTRQQASAR